MQIFSVAQVVVELLTVLGFFTKQKSQNISGTHACIINLLQS
jgi:hypothetical protein